MEPSSSSLSFAARVWVAFACFLRVLSDTAFAGSVRRLAHGEPPEPAPIAPPVARAPPVAPAPLASPVAPVPLAALQLLALFQSEGRLVDFLEQDIQAFTDADVGAAARVVHEGCRRVLRSHTKLTPVRTEEEGARVTVADGVSPDEVKLTGNVQGTAPFTGVLRHRGWRANDFALPAVVRAYDASVVAPAEVEL